MNLVFALRIFTDLCYFMFAAASLATLASHSGLLMTSPLIVAAAAYFVPLVQKKWPARPRLRFAPLAVCALSFAFTRTTADVVVTIPMIGYLFFVIFRDMTDVDYDGTLSRFFFCLKLLPAPIFLALITSNKDGIVQVMLPYFFFFLVLSFMLLRMLRHSEKMLSDRKFRLMNVAEIAMLCGAGYLMSSGLIISVFKFIGNMLIRFVFRPIFTGVSYVFGGFVWLLNKLFGWIDLFPEGVDVSALEGTGVGMTEGETAIWEYYEEAAADSPATQIITYLAMGIGALILIIAVVLLFRALLRAGRRSRDNQFSDVRESLDEKNDGGKARLGLSYRDRVRQQYKKFLKRCYKLGVDPEENLNSRDINEQVDGRFSRSALKRLRDVYIRARYSSRDISKEDLRAAREAYDALENDE
jgi:hypothetical protein